MGRAYGVTKYGCGCQTGRSWYDGAMGECDFKDEAKTCDAHQITNALLKAAESKNQALEQELLAHVRRGNQESITAFRDRLQDHANPGPKLLQDLARQRIGIIGGKLQAMIYKTGMDYAKQKLIAEKTLLEKFDAGGGVVLPLISTTDLATEKQWLTTNATNPAALDFARRQARYLELQQAVDDM